MFGHDVKHTGQSIYKNRSGPFLKMALPKGFYVQSSPAIGSDGTIYVGSDDYYLYAIGGSGIYGQVTDLNTGAPIAGATISTIAGDIQSAAEGTYGLMLDPGVYDVTVSKTGYETITIPNVVVQVSQSTELAIDLTTPGPLNIVTTDLLAAEVGVDYNARVRISGGTYPYAYSIPYGSQPPGLSLDPAYGSIYGTPPFRAHQPKQVLMCSLLRSVIRARRSSMPPKSTPLRSTVMWLLKMTV